MDILICNGKLTCNKSSKLSFNVLFRTLYHYAYTLKTVNLPSTVLSWCAVTPKWCFELQGRLKRKLMKMQMTWEKFLENSKAPWHTDQAVSARVWASHAHPRAATQACTPRTVIRGTVKESHGLRPVSRSITCQRDQPVPESQSRRQCSSHCLFPAAWVPGVTASPS